jgi:asparagine synthase (glutamine-hydrolysing)
MCSSDKRLWISYNGEIYNYLELKNELVSLGYRFIGSSDTEVFLAAFQQWGTECFKKLNGMWAVAIYDCREKRLILCRDRFGIKPIYLWISDKKIAFASEIKAFTQLPGWNARINDEMMLDFLAWKLMDHTDQTMFRDVVQIKPSSYAIIDLKKISNSDSSPEINLKRWYDIEDQIIQVKEKSIVADLHDLLLDSVQMHLRSDVPVGSCLSGGLDSSSIVCLMGRILDQSNQRLNPIHTFTGRSENSMFDEYGYAEKINQKVGCISHTVVTTASDLFLNLDSLTWHQGEPFISTSVYAQWCVFKMAKDAGVTVMLDGQGADEILGGYDGFIGASLAQLIRNKDYKAWWGQAKMLRKTKNMATAKILGYTLAYLSPQNTARLFNLNSKDRSSLSWLTNKYRNLARSRSEYRCAGRAPSVREMSLAQLQSTNLPMLLHWEDRNSMAQSIEARVPFLDHRVVEYCLSIPSRLKVADGKSKLILRQAMRGLVPDIVLDRNDKMGFVTAEELWFRKNHDETFRNELINSVETVSGVFSGKLVDQYDEFLRGQRNYDSKYWRAISVSRWVKKYNVSQ